MIDRKTLRLPALLLMLLLPATLLLTGCHEDPVSPAGALDEDALLHAEVADFDLDPAAPSKQALSRLYSRATRHVIAGDLAHYQFEARLGPGEYDVVRLHRLVRERKRFRPVRTTSAVLMVPGSGQPFEAIFLKPGVDEPDAHTSAPVYLAASGIDVWGIDLSWTQVPADAEDVSFMQDWGVERDVGHTLAAMSVARLLRGLTGQGFGRMQLLGFSYGAVVAYAAAGRETQQPMRRRDIGGIIPVDAGLKVAEDDRRQGDCANADRMRDQLAAGVYRSDVSGFHLLAQLALAAPDDPSPAIPGFTNYQAVLFIGTNPGAFWHFVAVDFDASGLPAGLLYSDPGRWIRLLPASGSIAVRASLDVATTRCGEEDVSIDDHLAEIAVPILVVTAAGGFGPEEQYTASPTASRDVTLHNVSVLPNGPRARDYGHADLFIGEDASRLAWDVLRRWLAERSSRAVNGVATLRSAIQQGV